MTPITYDGYGYFALQELISAALVKFVATNRYLEVFGTQFVASVEKHLLPRLALARALRIVGEN
jgi:hypothetical protein